MATDHKFKVKYGLTVKSGGITNTGDTVLTGTSGSGGNAFVVNRGSTGSQAIRIQNTGEVVISSNYLYATSSGVSLYVQNSSVFRGTITNDGGNTLSISSGSANISFNSKNFTNVGTISSGAITSSGLTFTNGGDRYITGPLNSSLIINAKPNDSTEGLKLQINGVDKLSLLQSGNATFAGTISSGAITSTGHIQSAGALKVTETGTAQVIMIGNQDSGGVNTPAMIMGVNGAIRIGHGSSWSGEGGTFTEKIAISGSDLKITSGGLILNATTVIDSSRNLTNIGTINTGQGATEVYLMNQNVRSSDSPTFQDLTIQGNLSITGDINSYNVTDLDVVDKTITLGVGGTASANDGGGIIVDGANAKLTWNNTNSYWQMNKKLAFNDTATTSNQGLGLVWSGFDKEATNDFTDNASIVHTTNTGGHAGSVLLFTAQNDANDGIAFVTNASSSLKHNSSNILTAANFTSNITPVDSTKLPLAGGTMTGTLNMGGNAFTGNNFNISGVNQISLNDPGEGIVFGSNCNLYLLDDAADNILRLDAPGGFRLHNGPLSMGTTTVIDTSRNLTNIGTISSGAITSSGRISAAATGTAPSSAKLHVGAINSTSSSAIAQFGGFIRAAHYLILHDGAGSANTVQMRNTGGHVDLTQGEGSHATPATRVNSIASPDGTQLVFPNNNGMVMIGSTSTPATKLHVNSGGTNVVATFQSTDGIAGIKLQDSGGNVELSASGSTFRVQPSGGTPVLEVNSSGNANFTGQITINGTESTLRNSSGVTLKLTTNGSPGSTSSKLPLHIDFNGYGQSTMARIRSWDESSSTADGFLEFYTNNYTGSHALRRVLLLDNDRNATFDGNIAVSGTVDGVDIAARNAVLTSTTTTANAALPKAGGTMTGNLSISKDNPVLVLKDTTASSNANQVAYISFQDNSGEEAWIGWGSSGNSNFTINNSIGSVILNGNGTTVINDNLDLNGNADISGNVTVNNNLYIGDGNDGYFYNDVAGRTAFRSGDFYIQDTVTNFYNYATNQYYGDSSGDNIHFRGNVLNGTGWSINGAGKFSTRDIQPQAGYHLQRSDHHSGHLEGSYNNVGANSAKSNPIYTIGSSYNPTDAALSNMYGIGYSHSDATFYGGTGVSGWGMYVAADGDARVFLGGSNGVISSTGQHYVGSNVVWNAGNDGSGSGLDADLLDGQQLSYVMNYDNLSNRPTNISNSDTVDGIHAASFLRSDAADSATGTLDLNGRVNIGYSVARPAALNSDSVAQARIGGTDVFLYVASLGASGGYDVAVQAARASDFASFDLNLQSNGGNLQRAGNKVWDAGNDGSGSGLDADLLDGVQASGFVNQNGTYTLASGYSVAQGDWGLRNTTPSGWIQFGPANTSHAHIYTDRSNFYFNVNTMYQNGHLIWAANNDGSGSGLDADTVDGTHLASIYSNSAVANTSVNKVYENTTITYGASYLQWTDNSGTGGTGLNGAAPGNPFSDWHHHLVMNHGNGGGYYVDIASSFHSDRVHFRRNQNGTLGSWREFWHTGNDGSGSGLDADLLDGYNSAENGGSTIHRLASNGYSQLQNWTNVASAGIYSATTNGAHFYPNTTGSYGTWKIDGARGGYTGTYLTGGGGVVTGMYDSGGNGGDYSSSATGGWHYYYHRGNRCLGVGESTTSSSYGLYEQGGGIYSTGNITAYSDRRVKENIRTIDNALETVEQMRGVYYNRIDDEEKKTVIGFIAQEVDEVEGAKPLVTYAEDVDQYGVSYGNTTALLVEAVKELTQQVKDLKQEIEEIKNVK